MKGGRWLLAGLMLALPLCWAAVEIAPAMDARTDRTTRIAIDVAANRHPISPLIYGVSFASGEAVRDLRLPVVRAGGNSASLYNWRTEARQAGRDWYFESLPIAADEPAQYGARFVERMQAAGATSIVTVPMIGWAAKLAPDGGKLASFSTVKYGAQQQADDVGLPTAGNGVRANGTPVTGNDPNDAAAPAGIDMQRDWVRSLVGRFGTAARGGVPYYTMDNETTRWHDIHRDVHPIGLHAEEQARLTIAYSRMVKSVDPSAKIVAPEAWGWGEYQYSGYDQQLSETSDRHNLSDRNGQMGGMDLLPWLLDQWKRAGHPVDVVSVHFYPQGGEFRGDGKDDVSPMMQRQRNRSTRLLWDPNYLDTSWIAAKVALIPRLKEWIRLYYDANTPVAITEYDWGAEDHMNGATTQADIWGIFGREGLDMAARWMTPKPGSPVYQAMKLFRNFDGKGGAFGETSVAANAPDPDTVAAFAAMRSRDGVLTVMVINKQLEGAAPVSLTLGHYGAAGRITGARLAKGRTTPLPHTTYADGVVRATLPPQSITLMEIHADAR